MKIVELKELKGLSPATQMILKSSLPVSYHWIHMNGGQIGLGMGSQEAGVREQVKYHGAPRASPSPEYELELSD